MMNIKRSITVSVCMVFILAAWLPVQAIEDGEEISIEVSKAWLNLVDNNRYAESWEAAATYFKKSISKEQWQQSLSAVRTPLGRVLKRKLKSTRFALSLPGAPDGEYVIIQYETSFENKKSAIETVTPMLDRDGKWRVSGYYIK